MEEQEELMRPTLEIQQSKRKYASSKRDLGKEWRLGLKSAMTSSMPSSTYTGSTIDVVDSSESDSESESKSSRDMVTVADCGYHSVSVVSAVKMMKAESEIHPNLLGTSKERKELRQRQEEEEYQYSLEEDRRKEEKKKDLELEEKGNTLLESLRQTRSLSTTRTRGRNFKSSSLS